MDKTKAVNTIKSIFQRYKSLTNLDQTLLSGLSQGKLYELYVLSELLLDLKNRGFQLQFSGQTLKFKAAPGKIKPTDPHFMVTAPNGKPLRLFVDIEFYTLGKAISEKADYSIRHELDIVLVDTMSDYPNHDNILIAVECKSVANFRKSVVKEALGIRRELSYLSDLCDSELTNMGGSPSVSVPANPASEFWLAYIHEVGNLYTQSPAVFGIQFKHLAP